MDSVSVSDGYVEHQVSGIKATVDSVSVSVDYVAEIKAMVDSVSVSVDYVATSRCQH